jgi:hypothetical protein
MSEKYVVRKRNGDMLIEIWNESSKPLMQCGHAAQGTMEIPNFSGDGKIDIFCCVICNGRESRVVSEPVPSLVGRIAKCTYCKKTESSSLSLPFFEYSPSKEFDSFYDGCEGWD